MAETLWENGYDPVPFNGMVLTGCAAPTPVNNLTRTEQETLLASGITPLETTAAGELAIVRAVSTNNTGVSAQYPDLWIRILDYVRESVNTRLRDQFAQSKLNDRVVAAVKDCVFDTLKRLEIAEIEGF